MAKDQLITLDTHWTNSSVDSRTFTVPGGNDGRDGLTRETELLKFDVNQPDTEDLFACGRVGRDLVSGMYIRLRDYIPNVSSLNIIVTYSILDVPYWSGNSSCVQLTYSVPARDDEGRIYCDVTMMGYLIFTQYLTIGEKGLKTTYRPVGTSGSGTVIPTSTDAARLDCLRFYRSVLY